MSRVFWKKIKNSVTVHGPAESFRRRSGAWEGQEKEAFLVSSVAGTKAERREKEADRANYGELLKDFTSVST